MDIKNPADIQTKTSINQSADGQNTASGASSDFLIRTMRGDLEALSKNIKPASLKLEPQTISLTQPPVYQPQNNIRPSTPVVKPTPTVIKETPPPARLDNISAKTAPKTETFGGAPSGLPVLQEQLKTAIAEATKHNIVSKPQAIPDKSPAPQTPIPKPPVISPIMPPPAATRAAHPATPPPAPPKPIVPIVPTALTASKSTNPPISNLKPAGTSVNASVLPPKNITFRFPAVNSLITKPILVIGAIIIIAGLLAAAGWYLWQKQNNPPVASTLPTPFISENSTPTPTSSITPTLAPSPSQSPVQKPIFNADKQELILLKDGRENTIAREIADRLAAITDAPKGSFTELLFKSSTKNAFLNLSDLTANLPTDILELTDGKDARLKNYLNANRFSLLLYSQAPLNSSPFTGGDSNQNRAVLAIATNATSSRANADLWQILSKNEPRLLTALSKLLPAAASKKTDIKFSDGSHSDITIRFFDFIPSSELSIDYTILNGVLLIGTSKESTHAAIDKILTE